MGYGNHDHFEKDRQMINTARLPWEPRTKLIAGLIFILGVVSLQSPLLLTAAFIFALCFALIGGLALSQLLRRLALLLPLLALMSLPLLFSTGLPLPPDRVEMVLRLSLKVLTAMTFTLFVFNNQPIENLLEALEHLRMPAVVTTIIYLAYRYGFLFIHEVQTMMRALIARLFEGRISRTSLAVYGEIAGGLFIKSLNRSETVYRAMASRGFQGSLPIGPPRRILSRDLIRAALPLFLITILLAAEKVVL